MLLLPQAATALFDAIAGPRAVAGAISDLEMRLFLAGHGCSTYEVRQHWHACYGCSDSGTAVNWLTGVIPRWILFVNM